MPQPVVIEAVRTPFGRKGGAFRETRPDSILAGVLAGLCERAKVSPAKIEDVVTGCVSQAGEQGANVGRLAVLLAGFPVEVPAVTLNRMCGSSHRPFILPPSRSLRATLKTPSVRRQHIRACRCSATWARSTNSIELAKFNLIHQGECRAAQKYKTATSTNSRWKAIGRGSRHATSAPRNPLTAGLMPPEFRRNPPATRHSRYARPGQDRLARHGLSAGRQRRGHRSQLEPDLRRRGGC
jgi:hypothetical protein